MQDLPPGISSVTDIADDFTPRPLQIPKEDLIRAIRSRWHDADTSDTAWVIAQHDDWSIEFSLGGEDPVDSFALHVRGSHPPLPEVADLLSDLGLNAIDPQAETGVFSLDSAIESFGGWAAYRDRVIEGDSAER